MEKTDKVYLELSKLGLDDCEIESIIKRNKLLTQSTEDDILEVVNFFKVKCELEESDIAKIVMNNPLILSESFARFDILFDFYNNIGFSKEEYKAYLRNFDRAFSLNPSELASNISRLIGVGKDLEEIKHIMIEKPYNIF